MFKDKNHNETKIEKQFANNTIQQQSYVPQMCDKRIKKNSFLFATTIGCISKQQQQQSKKIKIKSSLYITIENKWFSLLLLLLLLLLLFIRLRLPYAGALFMFNFHKLGTLI